MINNFLQFQKDAERLGRDKNSMKEFRAWLHANLSKESSKKQAEEGNFNTDFGSVAMETGTNGLTIRLREDFNKEELKQALEEKGEIALISEFFEELFANSSWREILPEDIGALTSAPILGEEVNTDDQGNLTSTGNVYWYPNYQVRSFFDDLIENGTTFFEGAPEDGSEEIGKESSKKQAGTWALPFKKEDALKLKRIVQKYEKLIPSSEIDAVKDELYNVLGNDDLFDHLDEFKSERHKNEDQYVIPYIKSTLEQFLKQYKENPESFSEPFEPEALEILEKIVGRKESSKKTAEPEDDLSDLSDKELIEKTKRDLEGVDGDEGGEEEKKQALAKFLGISAEEVVYEGHDFEAEGGEYAVYTDDEADRVVFDRVKEDLEDNPAMFNQDWLQSFIYITDTDKRVMVSEEESNLRDELGEDADEDTEEEIERRLKEFEDGLDNPIQYFVHDRGMFSAEDLMKQNWISIEINEAVQGAIDTDGRGHFLDRWSGEENEEEINGNMYFIYRTN